MTIVLFIKMSFVVQFLLLVGLRIFRQTSVSTKKCLVRIRTRKIRNAKQKCHVCIEILDVKQNSSHLEKSFVMVLFSSIFYKQTNKMHFLYVFILQSFATLHVSIDCFVHHQEFINLVYLELCTNHGNVPNCSVLRLELVPIVRPSS